MVVNGVNRVTRVPNWGLQVMGVAMVLVVAQFVLEIHEELQWRANRVAAKIEAKIESNIANVETLRNAVLPAPTVPYAVPQIVSHTPQLAVPVNVGVGEKKFVAVCAATRSRLSWTKLDTTDPGRVLLPSIAATTTKADNIRVFLGVDSDDRYWVPWRNKALVKYANETWKLDVSVFTYTRNENHIPFNALMRDVYDLGAEYLVRVNDDTEFETRGWVNAAQKVLRSYDPPNVGVVGPVCQQGNRQILTHDMVHRTHLDIFESYYPPQFSNWYVDDWISQVYGPARTTKLKTWTVKHHLTPSRYRAVVSDKSKLADLLAEGNQRIENHIHSRVLAAPKYAIFTTSDASHLKKYERNLNTMRCYAKKHSDYELAIFSESDTHLQHGCDNHHMMFLRHCMLSNYLNGRQDIVAVLVLDSDNAILDTKKRFEDFAIKDLNFEIRFHNGEIACSTIIARNTEYTRQFFKDWGNTQHFPFNADNGALHQIILTRLGAKDKCLKQSKHYGEFRKCFVSVVNEQNCDYDFFNNHATVAFPLHTFSYDGWLTKYRYSDKTFIHHAMKNPPIGGNNNGRLMPDVWTQNCKLDKANDPYYISVTEENDILHSKLAQASTHRWLEGGMTLSSCLRNKQITEFTVVVSVSQGFDDMFRNWLYWYQKASVRARLVVYAEDRETFSKYQNCAHFILRSASNESAGEAFAYNTGRYNALVSRRPSILLDCMYEFGNLLYSDVDIIWKRSPLSWLVDDYDVWAQDDKSSDNVCTGFMALRRTPNVIQMLKQWSKQQEHTTSINQKNFNTLILSMKLKVYHLPMSLFVNGHSYFDTTSIFNESSLVTIHNNFIIGKPSKTLRFQQRGLWKPLADNFCTHMHLDGNVIKMQQSPEQTAVTVDEITHLQSLNVRCNLLVFGIGYDAIFWHKQNRAGRTVFLEHDMEWLQKIKKQWPELEAYHVQYHTLIRRDLLKYQNSSAWPELSMNLPKTVNEETWHIILVDGPTGYNQETYGRFQSLYMSVSLRSSVNALIVVDDCERELERMYSSLMLGTENKFLEIERPSTPYAAANKQCYFRRVAG